MTKKVCPYCITCNVRFCEFRRPYSYGGKYVDCGYDAPFGEESYVTETFEKAPIHIELIEVEVDEED